MSKLFKLAKSVKKFHNDERGLEALQVVMIIAVAAVIMLLVRNYYDDIKEWVTGLVDQMTGDWSGV